MKYFIIFCVFIGVVYGDYDFKNLIDVVPDEAGVIQTRHGDDTSRYTLAQRKEKCAEANTQVEKKYGANPLSEDKPSKTLPLLVLTFKQGTNETWDHVTGFMCFAKRHFVLKEVGQDTTLYVGEPDVESGIERGTDV